MRRISLAALVLIFLFPAAARPEQQDAQGDGAGTREQRP